MPVEAVVECAGYAGDVETTSMVVVKPGATYHLLLLHGYKDPAKASEPPLLLGSGYIKYKLVTGGNTVIIRMAPVLIGATLNDSQWPVTKNKR